MTIIIDKVDCPFVTLSGIRHLRWRVATTSWQVLSLRGLCRAERGHSLAIAIYQA